MANVLLVEDDNDIREDLADFLREEGYGVAVARDGVEALDRLRSGDRPCAILLDLMMPRMDGWQFRDEQRKDPDLAPIPVLILSGAGDLRKHVEELGACGYVSKPFKLDQLLDTLSDVCFAEARSALSSRAGHASPASDASLAAFMRDEADVIVAEWKDIVRAAPEGGNFVQPLLLDHYPDLLRCVADVVERGDGRRGSHPEEVSEIRIEPGFDIREVVLEYSLLRDCILRRWGDRLYTTHGLGQIAALDRAIDDAIGAWVARYAQVCNRASAAALRSQDLYANEERLRLAMAATAMGTWDWDLIGGEVTWDARCAEIFGVPGETAQTYQSFLSRVHPEDVPRLEQAVRDAMDPGTGGEYAFEFRTVRLPDGEERWVWTRARTRFDAEGTALRLVGTVLDVTERKHAEHEQRFLKEATVALASSLNYRETLARIAKLAVPALADWCTVHIVDGDRIEWVAIEHVDPTKIQLVDELRRYCSDFRTPRLVRQILQTAQPRIVDDLQSLLEGSAAGPEQGELLRSLAFHSAMIVPLVVRGRVVGIISFVSPASRPPYAQSDLAVAEELASRAALALDNARLYGDAQEAARQREEMLAVVSHDLRNPLGAIHMSAAVLVRKLGSDPSLRKQLETIERSTSRMDHLLGDLLDMASIQAGRLSIERSPENAAALLNEAIEAQEASAREKGVAILRTAEIAGQGVHCDRDRVLQVLGNLIGNAVKFCDSSGVVTVSAEALSSEVRFKVSDTGPGIGEAELPHIFEPYWSAKRYASKGTGLGLYISKGIVEAHGGRMWVESDIGRGAAFYFTLPLASSRQVTGASVSEERTRAG